MAKPRKRHVQQDMLTKDGTRFRSKRAINKRKHRGGKSRKSQGKGSRVPHRAREVFTRLTAVHVTVRVAPAVQRLRTRAMYKAVRAATAVVARRVDMRIVQLSIQDNHLHLLVEANHQLALARGMQGFLISAAKHINRTMTKPGERRRRGPVFVDRYHVEILRTPSQTRNALSYVLNNWRRHDEHRNGEARMWMIDRFSSAVQFDGWKERQGLAWVIPPDYELLAVRPAQSWLLREGWRRCGLISLEEIPGPRDERWNRR